MKTYNWEGVFFFYCYGDHRDLHGDEHSFPTRRSSDLPSIADVTTGGSGNHLVSTAADAGVYVLLAIGLNVVVGFDGLLDLGYAAFFAIGAYTYGLLASGQLSGSPLHHEFHLPFWVLILVAMFVAAAFGAILGAPTLRLRGDYLAIVTLGFGEIVPRVFRFLGAGSPIGNWTGG